MNSDLSYNNKEMDKNEVEYSVKPWVWLDYKNTDSKLTLKVWGKF